MDTPIFVFSPLALAFVALERFLRIILGSQAAPKATLPNLLQQATGRKQRLFSIDDPDKAIEVLEEVRLAMMHGVLGMGTEAQKLLGWLHPFSFDLLAFIDSIVASIDPATGLPLQGSNPIRFVPSSKTTAHKLGVLTPDADLRTLRNHNLQFGATDPQEDLLLLAEGALCLVMVETACRKALGDNTPNDGGPDWFRHVVSRAVLDTPKRLRIPFIDETDGVNRMCEVRNSLLHGNYEQAARGADCANVRHYFKTQFASEIERMFKIYESFRLQLMECGALPVEGGQ